MKNFNLLSLGNRVLIDGQVFDLPGFEEGVIINLGEKEVEVVHTATKKTYKCGKDQIEVITLDNVILTSLGFSERSISCSDGTNKVDRIKCTDPIIEGEIWYLISMQETKRGILLSVLENGIETIGTGYPKTLNQLQNMVKFITNGNYEI